MSRLDEIQKIDARLAEIAAEVAHFEAVARSAEAIAGAEAGVVEQVATVEARRRNVLADWLLGLAQRSDVEVIDREAEDAQRKAEAARADEALRRLGAQAVRDRCQPLHAERAQLDKQRDLLVRQHVRELAEVEARVYREHALALATSLA